MRKNYLDLLPPNGSSEAFGTTWSSISVPAKVKGSVISGLPIVDESTENLSSNRNKLIEKINQSQDKLIWLACQQTDEYMITVV